MTDSRNGKNTLLFGFLGVLRRLGLVRGVFAEDARTQQPTQLLELYSLEGCPACRRVRIAMTELDLDYIHRSCPVGSANRPEVERRGGRIRFPYLVDPNTKTEMYESRNIVRYLNAHYGARLGASATAHALGER